MGEAEPRRSGVREYATEEIVVRWEPRFCIHSSLCVRALPAVFDRDKRPWIDPANATADDLARTISSCPSGALHFERLDGGAQETAEEPLRIDPQTDGPLYLRGRVRIAGPDGGILREDTRVALCRCGGSRRKPFCDGSHEENGFRAPP
jgi:uncharacterized Fe-S cluster protein YjdI